MQKLWKQYIEKGIEEQQRQEIVLPDTRIEITVGKGQDYEGSFDIATVSGGNLLGCIYSSSYRMQLKTQEIQRDTTKIFYTFHADGLEEKSVVKGEFILVTTCGQYSLPFVVSVEKPMVSSSEGNVKNLDQFVQLAEDERLEATGLFYKSDFQNILKNAGKKTQLLYKLLSGNVFHKEFEMEEFLKAVAGKEPVSFYLKEESRAIDHPTKDEEFSICIHKNGNGYVELQVEAEGDFIQIEKAAIYEEDFIGKTCKYVVKICKDKLHAGHNSGRILFYYGTCRMEYTITVDNAQKWDATHAVRKEIKDANVALLDTYLKFQKSELTKGQWIKKTKKLLQTMYELDKNNPLYLLLEAQLCVIEKKYDNAVEKMEECKIRKLITRSDYSNYAYFLYLSALIDSSSVHVRKNLDEIRLLSEEHPDSYELLWFSLHLDKRYESNLLEKYVCIETFCKRGHMHPILYAEALHILEKDVLCMQNFDNFAQRLTWWAIRQGRMTQELKNRVVYLIKRQRLYSKRIFDILEYFYKETKEEELALLLCTMLVKSNRTDKRAFLWYRFGINHGMAITKLYEFYLDSVPEDFKEPFERQVFLYFSMDTKLSAEKKSILYANLCMHKEKYPELMERFCIAMQMHVREQLCDGKLTRELALLYRYCLPKMTITNDMWEPLGRLMFMRRIELQDKRIRNVIVRHELLQKEEMVPVYKNNAWLTIYVSEYELVLEDFNGKRYPCKNAILEEVLPVNIAVEAASKSNCMNVGIALFQCFEHHQCQKINVTNVESARYLLQNNLLVRKYHIMLMVKLVEYYQSISKMEDIEELLQKLPAEELQPVEFKMITDYLVDHGADDIAYRWIVGTCYENASELTLLKLCSCKTAIADDGDACLIELCYYLFQCGKYDEKVLRYLISYYEGTVKDLSELFIAGIAFELDVRELAERILMQIAVTGAYVENLDTIFQYYMKNGYRESVLQGFYKYEAYSCLRDDITISQSIWNYMEAFCMDRKELSDVCSLALCQHYSELDKLSDEQKVFANKIIKQAMSYDIYMSAFLKLPLNEENAFWLKDKCIVEHKGKNNPRIHYVLDEKDRAASFVQEEMNPIIPGVFSKPVILFSGEKLHYYITESLEDASDPVESNLVIKNEEALVDGNMRYDAINDMIVSLSMKEDQTLETVVEHYFEEVYLVNRMFTIR